MERCRSMPPAHSMRRPVRTGLEDVGEFRLLIRAEAIGISLRTGVLQTLRAARVEAVISACLPTMLRIAGTLAGSTQSPSVWRQSRRSAPPRFIPSKAAAIDSRRRLSPKLLPQGPFSYSPLMARRALIPTRCTAPSVLALESKLQYRKPHKAGRNIWYDAIPRGKN